MSSASNPPPAVTPATPAATLGEHLHAKTATIGVVGLGYVGLPLVRSVHTAGFPVIGYDADATKIEMLQRGRNYLHHLGSELAETLAASGRFEPTADAQR